MSATDATRLRVGILCDGPVLQRWQAEAIRAAMQVPGVDLCLVVEQAPSAAPEGSVLARQAQRPWGSALYRRWRRTRFRPPAMEPEDLQELLSHAPVLRISPEQRGHGQQIASADLDAIAAHRPDVLLRFGFGILKGAILDLPTHGVWSFHHGDPEHFRGGPPGFWEIMRGSPVTGAVLQRLTEKLDGGIILHQGWFKTIDHSLAETVDTVLMHSAHWPALVMQRLLHGDPAAALGATPKSLGPLYRYPGNVAFLGFLWKQFQNKLRFHREDLQQHEEWNLGVLYQPIHALLEDEASLNVRWLPAPGTSSFRADPFGYMAADGQLNVLYEKYDHSTGTGSIARLRPKRDNVLKRSRTMLETEGHLSYPYVVERDGQVYVIPESAASGRVDLHRVNSENDGLDPVATLLDEPLFDPTLFQHDGRWWLFGTKAPLTNVNLHAYCADRFEGPYRPHLLNPIKQDIRSARPGGTPFVHDGQLWRPAQDSSLTYGGRIALNRVLELTPTSFREETVKYIGPLEGSMWNKGLHTVAAVGNVTLVDGKRFVSVPERRKEAKERKLKRLKRNRERE